MKVVITTKNFSASENLKETIEKKMGKLGKYFSDDIEANVMVSSEGGRQKVESTINANGMIFRAEETTQDVYESIDKVVDKLSVQMSRFKSKLKRKGVDKSLIFETIPEYEEEPFEMAVVKTKKFDLEPMLVDEAIVRM
jgi:putative sigma-54 modulation protein